MSKHNCPKCRDEGSDPQWACRKQNCDQPNKALCPRCEQGEGAEAY